MILVFDRRQVEDVGPDLPQPCGDVVMCHAREYTHRLGTRCRAPIVRHVVRRQG